MIDSNVDGVGRELSRWDGDGRLRMAARGARGKLLEDVRGRELGSWDGISGRRGWTRKLLEGTSSRRRAERGAGVGEVPVTTVTTTGTQAARREAAGKLRTTSPLPPSVSCRPSQDAGSRALGRSTLGAFSSPYEVLLASSPL